MSKATTHLTPYQQFTKGWHKAAGPLPTAAEITAAEQVGRQGAKATLALAMYMRPAGATCPQVVLVCGAPCLNVRRQGIAAGKLVPVVHPSAGAYLTYGAALKGSKPKAARKVKAPKAPVAPVADAS